MSGVGNFSPHDCTSQHQTTNHLQEDSRVQKPGACITEELVESQDTEETPDIEEFKMPNTNQQPVDVIKDPYVLESAPPKD